jgi:manganese/zinc/iron transport system permease protein
VLAAPDIHRGGLAEALARSALRRRGLLDADDGLTTAGRAAAADLADRRDLWRAWLAHGSRVELPDAREPDPVDLRASLGDAAVDRLRELAGEARR